MYYKRYLKRLLLISIIITTLANYDISAVFMYRSIGDSVIAYNFFEKALAYEQQFEFDSTIKYLHLSYASFYRGNDFKQSIVCLSSISEKYRWMGYGDSALHYAIQSAKMAEDHLDYHSPELGSAFYQLGSAYNNMNVYEDAIEQFNCAIEIWEKNTELQHPHYPRTYANMGTIYSKKRDIDRALTYYHKALEKFQSFNTPEVQLALLYSNIGVAYDDKSQLEEAEKYNKKALDIRIKYWGKDHPVTAISLHNLGMVYIKKADYELAEQYLQDALTIWQNDTTEDVASALNNLGLLNYYKGNYHLAQRYFGRSLELRQIIYPPKHPDIAQSFNNLADIDIHNQNYKRAIRNINSASYANMLTSEISNIESIYTNSLSKIQLLESVQLYARAHFLIAEKENEIKHYKMAFSYYMAAIDIIERIRLDYRFETSKLYFSELQKNVYNDAVYLSVFLYNETRETSYKDMAFYSAERNKASVLLEILNDAEAQINSHIPVSLLDELKETKLNLQFYENLLQQNIVFSNNLDSLQRAELSKKVIALRLKNNQLIDDIETDYPSYYSLKYSNIVYSAQKIQQLTKSDEAIIEYFLIDTSEIVESNYLITFVITDDDFQIIQQKITKNELNQIEKYRSILENKMFDPGIEEYEAYIKTSIKLYNILLKPARPGINEKHLTIIPDGILSYIPFESMLTENPYINTIDFKNLPYSVLKHSFSYGFSATTLFFETSRKRQKKLYSFLGIAPSFSNEKPVFSNERNIILSMLPGAIDEVKGAENIIGGQLLLEEDATKENFVNKAPFYKILHLATHGYVNDEYPMQSSLYFQPDSNRIGDEVLTIRELYGIQLNAQLVVLSACNTGVGKLQKGEGIMSLARGFSYAGVPSIIMTLWEVNDQIGSSIMTRFYYYLSRGKTKAKALQLAKIDYINNTLYMEKLQPYYWSGYIQIGNYQPVFTRKVFIIGPALIIILLCGCLLFFRIRKRSKST